MNMLRASKVENVSCDEQAKFVQERLIETEDWFTKISSSFAIYTKISSRLCNATDSLASVLNDFATNERINKSTKSQILILSDLLASLGDLRDYKVHLLQKNIMNHIGQYNALCRNAKAEVKSIFNIKEKEVNKRKQLGKLRVLAPNNRERILRAEVALSTAIANASKAQRELEDHIILFEKKKIEDIKNILLEFISLELAEYSNAINILTQAFQEIDKVNVKHDLKDFGEMLKLNPMSLRLTKVKESTLNKPSQLWPNNSHQTSAIEEHDSKSEGEESYQTSDISSEEQSQRNTV